MTTGDSDRRMRLTVNYNPGLGLHPQRWRFVDNPRQFMEIDAYVEIAQIAEREGFDAIFLSDYPTFPTLPPHEPWHVLDPMLALAVIASHTSRIGLIATLSTTFNHPYDLARRIASLDHISGGRAAWNIVTTYMESAGQNFGESIPDPAHRYERAEEFMQVVDGLWAGWEDDALPLNQATGEFIRWDRVHPLDHQGKYFSVRGPLQTPTSPQRRPVLFQAGASADGMAFGARYADAVYGLQSDPSLSREAYKRVKDSVSAAGRDPDDVHFLPGIYPVVGSTEAEARAHAAELDAQRDLVAELKQFGERIGVPLEARDLDRRVPTRADIDPALRVSEGVSASHWQVIEKNSGLTLRQLLLEKAGKIRYIVGSPEQVADDLEHWFVHRAADGFNVSATHFPEGLERFSEYVLPILRDRGLVTRNHVGATFRDRLASSLVDAG